MISQNHQFIRSLFQALLKISDEAIVVTDLQANIVIANMKDALLHGYASGEDIVGKNAFDLIAPEDRERALENMRETLEKGEMKKLRYRLLKKDGNVFPVEMTASLVHDEEGKPQYFIGVLRDVSDRKLAEDALRESEKMFRTLFESSTSGLCLIDEEGNFLTCNDPLLKQCGYSRENLFALKNIAGLFQDESFKTEIMAKARTQKFLRQERVEMKRRDN
ncbi:MAG TPA: PAS domain S-box protein, partial [bacterium]|nr:PAS domain S-box protein [bacterium]